MLMSAPCFCDVLFSFVVSLWHMHMFVFTGKSSFLLALLRLNIITQGDILLDGSSLLAMSLEDARDAIAM